MEMTLKKRICGPNNRAGISKIKKNWMRLLITQNDYLKHKSDQPVEMEDFLFYKAENPTGDQSSS
jgi:hypothetical protein